MFKVGSHPIASLPVSSNPSVALWTTHYSIYSALQRVVDRDEDPTSPDLDLAI